jgi:hypothetical protein
MSSLTWVVIFNPSSLHRQTHQLHGLASRSGTLCRRLLVET